MGTRSIAIIAFLLFPIPIQGLAQSNDLWRTIAIEAVLRHPAVQAAERTYRAERLKIGAHAAPADPMVMAEWMNLPVGGASMGMRETQYSVTENFPFPVRLAMAASRQAMAAEAARWTVELRKRIAYRDAVRALLGLAFTDRVLEVGRERLAQYGMVESVVTARYGVGKASQSEWARTKLMVAMARADLAMQEGDRGEWVAALSRLAPGALRVSNQVFRFETLPAETVPSVEALADRAAADFPELRMQQAMEGRMKAEKNLMGWEWAPDISLRGTLTQSEAGSANASVGIGLSVPIWFAFRQAPNAAAAGAMLEAESARTRDARAMVREAVRMRHASFTGANRALSVFLSSAAPQVAQMVEVALKEYQVDRIGFTELLEALKSVSDTALEIARARRVLGEQAVEIRYFTGMRLLEALP
jgi:outer membrane protein TolC